MARKLTHEEFMIKVMEKNGHVRNGEIEILGEYINANEKIKCYCNIHDVIWYPFAASLYKGIGCKQCGTNSMAKKRRKTNEKFQSELVELRKKGYDIYSDDMYVNNHTKIWFYCSRGHKWLSRPADVLSGYGCPYCSGRNVIIGETSLWDTRSDVAVLLKDPEDGYKYSVGSDKKVEFICPVCKTVHKKKIDNVCRHGFSCNTCSDKVSYPQKFARTLLKQLPIVHIEYEYSPEWVKPYRFDCYFKYSGIDFLLELDGHFHSSHGFGGNEGAETLRRDLIKNYLALKHGFQIIRIDCKYKMSERFNYIKNSILNSRLNELFDLDNINWIECDIQGQEKLVPKVAELYSQGLCLAEIQDVVGYGRRTIGRWLKQATNIGLCNYNTKEAQSRGIRKSATNRVKVNMYTLDNQYITTYNSMIEAEVENKIANIYRACKDPSKQAGGYRWYYAADLNQPDKTKVITTIQN